MSVAERNKSFFYHGTTVVQGSLCCLLPGDLYHLPKHIFVTNSPWVLTMLWYTMYNPSHHSGIVDYPNSRCANSQLPTPKTLAARTVHGTHDYLGIYTLTKNWGCHGCRSQLSCLLVGMFLSVISAGPRIQLQNEVTIMSLGIHHFPAPINNYHLTAPSPSLLLGSQSEINSSSLG